MSLTSTHLSISDLLMSKQFNKVLPFAGAPYAYIFKEGFSKRKSDNKFFSLNLVDYIDLEKFKNSSFVFFSSFL